MADRDSPADHDATERAVRSCYSTWSGRYYDDYYRGAATYPPVHTDIATSAFGATFFIQAIPAALPEKLPAFPPGTTTMSGVGLSSTE